MKTIRQIADEIGVSKQAVYKRYLHMRNKAKELTLGYQLLLVLIICVYLISLVMAIGIKEASVREASVIIFIVGICSIIFLKRNDNKKKKEKIDPCEQVKELESFWIEEAVAQKLVIEFQPKNLEMLTREDYQFSPTHYEFLYNALKKYIEDNGSSVSFFLNASIIKNEKSSDQSIGSFLSSFVGALITGYVIDNADVVIVLVCMCFWAAIAIKTIDYLTLHKPKQSFYLSILNQLKKDLVPSEESQTAALPGVGNGSNDNDNADKS